MSDRHRALPQWMAKKKEEKVTEKSLKCRRKRKTTRAVFYCMNEKELVEAAVSYLTKAACEEQGLLTDQQVDDKAADTTMKMREDPSRTKVKPTTEAAEEEYLDCDAQDTTYVSETQDMETVPYTKSPQHRGPEGQRSGPDRDHGGLMNVGLETEEKQAHSQVPADSASEEDALRLVREIFFT